MQPTIRCHTAEFLKYFRTREKFIAAQAELYWLRRGCPEGSPEVDWYRAEKEIDQEFLSLLDLGIPS